MKKLIIFNYFIILSDKSFKKKRKVYLKEQNGRKIFCFNLSIKSNGKIVDSKFLSFIKKLDAKKNFSQTNR